MSASFLDIRFLLAICLISAVRLVCLKKYYVYFGAISSLLLVGVAAPGSLVLFGSIIILVIFPFKVASSHLGKFAISRNFSSFLLAVGISILAGLFILYKVNRQLIYPWPGLSLTMQGTLSLVGFSYFIFRAIDYFHIQLIKPTKAKISELLFFFFFPTTIMSGPIQKYVDFQQQVENFVPMQRSTIKVAAYRITRGFFRKIVLAVVLQGIIDNLMARSHFPGFIAISILVLLYLFFYFDFAGYSDIAIGLGLLLGIRVPENFRKPFLATTLSEFWRNWHITLVDWFRANVFIPLGGMRGSRSRAAWLSLLIMILCGFWHGLTLGFLGWGLWHGINLFVEAKLGIKPITPALRHGPRYWSRIILTNARVAVGCIFFIPDPQTAMRLLRGLIDWRL